MGLAPGDRVDRYEVVQLLGAGGMGEVYVARDPKLGRTVALKILRADATQGTDGAARLFREARAAAALSHANVLTVFDVGEVHEPEALRGLPYIAMELVTGRTLRGYVGDGTAPLARRIGWLRDVAGALAAAHRAGVVHRDVKPENVMVRADDGAVKVLDFGIARHRPTWAGAGASTEGHSLPTGASPVASTLPSEASSIAGTPFYMAPEQLRGEVVDGRADQFSWGVTAYALLTGRLPWQSEGDAIAILSQILSSDPPSPASLDPRIPPQVSAAVMRALSKSKDARFASMQDVADALAAAGSPSSASPPAASTAGAHPARRSRVLATSVVVAIAGVAGLAALALAARTWRAPAARASASSAPSAPQQATVLTERRLLMNGDRVSGVTLSPDGKTVAYFARAERDVARVYTQPFAGGQRSEVPVPSGVTGAWGDIVGFMADGSLLLRLESPADDLPIWQVSPAGGEPRVVGRLASHARGATISPDGKLVAVAGNEGIAVQPLSGERSTEVARKSSQALAWSPGSDRIAYGSYDPNDEWIGSVEVVSADGKRAVHIDASRELENTGGGMTLAWPDDHELLVARRRNGGGLLMAQPLDDQGAPAGPPRKRYAWPDTEVAELSVARSGGAIAFVKQALRSSILTARWAPDHTHFEAPLAPLAPDERSSVFLGWMGEDQVIFRARRDGAQSLYALPLAEGPATMLVRGITLGLSLATGDVVAWSEGDGDAGDGCKLLRVDATGAHALFTTAPADGSIVGCMSDLRCVKAPSGRRRCVASELAEGATVWSDVDLETGRKGKVLFRANQAPHGMGTHDFDLSPDGHTLAFTIDSTEGVGFVDLETGEARQPRVTPAFEPQFVRFLPGGRRVLLLGLAGPLDNGDCYVAVADLAGHAHIEARRAEWLGKPVLSPSGAQVGMNARMHERRLWALEPRAATEGPAAP